MVWDLPLSQNRLMGEPPMSWEATVFSERRHLCHSNNSYQNNSLPRSLLIPTLLYGAVALREAQIGSTAFWGPLRQRHCRDTFWGSAPACCYFSVHLSTLAPLSSLVMCMSTKHLASEGQEPGPQGGGPRWVLMCATRLACPQSRSLLVGTGAGAHGKRSR